MPVIMVLMDWIIYVRLAKAEAIVREFSEFKGEKSTSKSRFFFFLFDVENLKLAHA
jgi:hypothetical protein